MAGLIHTPAGWVQPDPLECPAGHRMERTEIYRGWRGCAECNGHIYWQHRGCDSPPIYQPPLGPDCG